MMRYALTRGGFVVADDDRRLGAFAYVTSDNWNAAQKDPESAALRMLENAWDSAPTDIREQHYSQCCQLLDKQECPNG